MYNLQYSKLNIVFLEVRIEIIKTENKINAKIKNGGQL